jgi:hypothetical protein
MARVVLDYPAVYSTAQRLTRPLVQRTSREILTGARRLAPRGDHLSGSGRRKSGRPLINALNAKIDVGVNIVSGYVGANTDWAATVHQGSEAHRIISKQGKILRFRWERGSLLIQHKSKGRRTKTMFWFPEVKHPGNKRPVRYLTTPMHLYGRANGFVTKSLPVSRSRLP